MERIEEIITKSKLGVTAHLWYEENFDDETAEGKMIQEVIILTSALRQEFIPISKIVDVIKKLSRNGRFAGINVDDLKQGLGIK